MHASQSMAPDTTRARPSGRTVTVGYQRPTCIGAAEDHMRFEGWKRFASGRPTGFAMCPPATNTRPSGNKVCPAQKRLSFAVVLVKPLVLGFQTRATPFCAAPSHTRIWPFGISVRWTPTIGHERGALHWPIREGSVAEVFATGMATGLDIVVLLGLAVSLATAVSACGPSAIAVVFHEMEYGAAVTSEPILTPSTLNCIPATATLSLAVAATVTVPLTVAPAAGAVIATVGGIGAGFLRLTRTGALVVQ